MLFVGMFVAPVAIEMSKAKGHFKWAERWLKQLWMFIFFVLTIYLCNIRAVQEMVMAIRRGNAGMGYVVCALLGAATFCGYWWFLGTVDSVSASYDPAQKQPGVGTIQQSSGSKSPNISGNNNTVNYSDPEVKLRLANIEKLLHAQQGDKIQPETLLKKYPFGYTIFNIDHTNSVYPYQAKVLSDWHLDLSSAQLESVDDKTIKLTLPNVVIGGTELTSAAVYSPKKIGPLPGICLVTDGSTCMKGEILAIGPHGIVFLVGFTKNPRS